MRAIRVIGHENLVIRNNVKKSVRSGDIVRDRKGRVYQIIESDFGEVTLISKSGMTLRFIMTTLSEVVSQEGLTAIK